MSTLDTLRKQRQSATTHYMIPCDVYDALLDVAEAAEVLVRFARTVDIAAAHVQGGKDIRAALARLDVLAREETRQHDR